MHRKMIKVSLLFLLWDDVSDLCTHLADTHLPVRDPQLGHLLLQLLQPLFHHIRSFQVLTHSSSHLSR
jgi:hypothetical protein